MAAGGVRPTCADAVAGKKRGGERARSPATNAGSTHARASEACARRPPPGTDRGRAPARSLAIEDIAASVCVIRCTLTPAIVFVATLTPIAYSFQTRASAAGVPTAQCQSLGRLHFVLSSSRFLRASAHWFVLTATIAGRCAAGICATTRSESLGLERTEVAAQRIDEGHDHRPAAELLERDRPAALAPQREARCELPADRPGHGRAGLADLATAGLALGDRSTATAAPIPTPRTSAPPRRNHRRRRNETGRRAGGCCTDTPPRLSHRSPHLDGLGLPALVQHHQPV